MAEIFNFLSFVKKTEEENQLWKFQNLQFGTLKSWIFGICDLDLSIKFELEVSIRFFIL